MKTLVSAAPTNNTNDLLTASEGDQLVHSAPASSPAPLKVLLSAYCCEPNLGSEEGVGWNTVCQVARRHQVWVLIGTDEREAVEHYLEHDPMPNVHWVFVDVPQWLTRSWKKGERGRRLHYMLWQYWAYLEGKRLQQEIGFDIVHHVTYASYWTPSYLALLNVPFVWGPVGGGDNTPLNFYSTLSWRDKCYELVRDTIRWTSHHLDPYVRLTAKRAAIAISSNEGTAAQMRHLGAHNILIQNESALPREDVERLNTLPMARDAETFRVISIGRFLGWKGYHLGIQAFAKLLESAPSSEYWIIGTGPENEHLKALAQTLGISDKVCFLGKLPRPEVMQRLGDANIFLHPSLHDTGSWAVLEAMSAGLPVVCLRRGGPAILVSDETGLRVSVNTPEQTINDLSLALLQLAKDPELCQQMGLAGRARVHEHFIWDGKSAQFDRIYRELVKQ